MKPFILKLLIIVAIISVSYDLSAQTGAPSMSLKDVGSPDTGEQSKNIIRTVNDLKTGNWQDVLSSFFQLSFSDLTGEKKALNFKANLFALKVKADSNLLLSDNYVREKFSRNFQFDFSLKLDTQYNFKGFQAGFTWALINKRDSSVVSFANTELDNYYSSAQVNLLTAYNNFRNSLLVNDELPEDKVSFVKEVKAKIDKVLEEKGFVAKGEYPTEFQPFLNDSYNINLKIADSLFAIQLEKLRLKPLLTLSVNSTFQNKDRAFSNGAAQIVYLQGIKTKRTKTELDFRTGFNIKDTLVVTTDRRTEFNSSLGINFALLENKSGKSIIEFKPYFEYNSILTDPYASEKKDKFTANADLRLRIFENFWLPLTIKYDLDKGKFLGFLDIEFNFDAFKKQK